jgi:threonylcarbamoyladenosine tRNA methylthiotransferase MtaB
MKVYALTLGCKVNQYESDALLTLFAKHGYEITEDIQEADVIIVNSCTVTSVSAGKSRQAVRRAKKNNPNAVVVLTGCYSEIDYEKAGQILEADIVTGANHKEKILELVEQALRNKERILVQNSQKNLTIDDLPTPVSGTRTRAFLKIQDGCNNYCSYCIIPFARGPVRSRDFDDCIKRTKSLYSKWKAKLKNIFFLCSLVFLPRIFSKVGFFRFRYKHYLQDLLNVQKKIFKRIKI